VTIALVLKTKKKQQKIKETNTKSSSKLPTNAETKKVHSPAPGTHTGLFDTMIKNQRLFTAHNRLMLQRHQTYQYGPQFSMGREISSRAEEFSLFCGILTFLQNFTEFSKS